MKSATAFRVQACRMHKPGQYTRLATCRVRKPGYYARLVSAPFTCSCLHGTVHLHTRKTWEDAEINTSCARRPCSTLQASNLPFPWHFPSCPLASWGRGSGSEKKEKKSRWKMLVLTSKSQQFAHTSLVIEWCLSYKPVSCISLSCVQA